MIQHWAPKLLQLDHKAKSMGELIGQLDAWVKPGITGAQFQKLFYQCQCGIIMTRRAFLMHECSDVIDLMEDVESLE